MNDEKRRKAIKYGLIAAIIALMAFLVASDALDTASINNVFQPVVNNTNLGIGEDGNGNRLPRVVYNASNYSLYFFLKYHVINNNAAYVVNFSINGTIMAWDASTTIQANENHSWPGIIVPKGANYSYDNTSSVHHVEIREYPVLAGKNGTLSVNQTIVTGGSGTGNASYPIDASNNSQIINNNQSYWRIFFQRQGTSVQGSWSWSNTPAETDYESVTGDPAGFWVTSGGLNLDEYKWNSIYLTQGRYQLTVIAYKSSNQGFQEALFDNTSLAIFDQFKPVNTPNTVNIAIFNLSAPKTGDLRLRTNGKNASSTGNFTDFSRVILEKIG